MHSILRCFWRQSSLYNFRSVRTWHWGLQLSLIGVQSNAAQINFGISIFEDLANQIRYWDGYVKAVQQHNLPGPGQFVTPAVAEWFSGFPCVISLLCARFCFDYLPI